MLGRVLNTPLMTIDLELVGNKGQGRILQEDRRVLQENKARKIF